MSSNKISFHFRETEANQSTYMHRFNNMIAVTWLPNFFVSNDEIVKGVNTVGHYKELAK